jgi:hypothetical protein
MRPRLWLCAVLVSAVGCSNGPKFAPVSGKVTLNGKPLGNAVIAFSPIAKEGQIDAGDGSAGKTNENGEYTLTTSRGVAGAQVGTHRVRISVLAEDSSSDKRRTRGGPALKDKIPDRYNGQTKLTFEVTAAGSNKADFELTSP